jgi:ubiquinol-cytochrome c reductase iron-sulfur subunit
MTKEVKEVNEVGEAADTPDLERRRFLCLATSVVGGLGMCLASVPFFASWFPSKRTRAMGGPIELDISVLAEGQAVKVAWRGKPVFVVHRSAEVLAKLLKEREHLRDPDSQDSEQPAAAQNQYRALNEKFLVVTGVCTHLGCIPLYQPQLDSVEAGWQGGFFCPCHGSKYDLAGRVFKGAPAPTNLSVPEYKYVNEHTLVIGVDV